MQNELKTQDSQVRKKIHELNTFIQSVKVAFEDSVSSKELKQSLANLDHLLEEVDNPHDSPATALEKEEANQMSGKLSKNVSFIDGMFQYKVIDGREKTIVYQARMTSVPKTPEQEPH